MNKALVMTDDVQENAPVSSKRSLLFEWRWVVLACILLSFSGGIRYWREWQFHSLSKGSEVAPFALEEIPRALGDWHVLEGSESTLEPEIARIATGAPDPRNSVQRTYVNEKSGESVEVLIIYGLASSVFAHTPDACYPAIGFKSLPSGDQENDIPVPNNPMSAQFRRQHFLKSKAGQTVYREVYYSFENAGQWRYDMEKHWKAFRFHPGMFKVQVQCQGGRTDESSVKDLLGRIVQEIEGHSAAKG